eukprot:2861742-Rhodomonas_salina.2
MSASSCSAAFTAEGVSITPCFGHGRRTEERIMVGTSRIFQAALEGGATQTLCSRGAKDWKLRARESQRRSKSGGEDALWDLGLGLTMRGCRC